MTSVTRLDVAFDEGFQPLDNIIAVAQPVPLPIISLEEYNARYEEYRKGPHYAESLGEDDSSEVTAEGSLEPLFDSEEFRPLGPDGKYTRRETRHYPVNAVGKLYGEPPGGPQEKER